MNPADLNKATSSSRLTSFGKRLRRSRQPTSSQASAESPAPSPNPLLDIGTRLHDLRQEQAKTIDEIAAETMIPARLLTAIEAGQAEVLPEPVFVKGMIRRYAEALGLDGQAWAASFASPPAAPTQNAPAQPAVTSNVSTTPKPRPRPVFKFHPVYLYLLYIAIIVAAGSGLSHLLNHSPFATQPSIPSPPTVPQAETQAQKSPESQAAGGATQPKQSPESKATETQQANAPAPAAVSPSPTAVAPSPQPGPTSQPSQASEGLQVGLSLTEDSWMEIVVDGKPLVSQILTAGSKKTVTAKQTLTIRAGNAGGVLLSVNNEPGKVMGERGAIEQVILEAGSQERGPSDDQNANI